MYTYNLKLHKGTDNVIMFTFVNQDQKPVNNTNATFTFRVMDREGEDLLLSKTLEDVVVTKGTAKVTITEQDLDGINPQKANFSIERTLSTSNLYDAVFVDDNMGGRGVIEILDSVLPTHTASQTVSIPSFYDGPGVTTHYSSQWQSINDVTTVQYKPSSFTGNIQVEGATSGTDGLWYNIGTEVSLTSSSDTAYINVSGYHPYMRLRIEETSGSITEIKVR